MPYEMVKRGKRNRDFEVLQNHVKVAASRRAIVKITAWTKGQSQSLYGNKPLVLNEKYFFFRKKQCRLDAGKLMRVRSFVKSGHP